MREDVYVQEFGRAMRHMWLHWVTRFENHNLTNSQIDAHVNTLWQQQPQADHAPQWEIGIRPGERVTLAEAYQQLQKLIDRASLKHMPLASTDGITDILANRHWTQATELAERILCAKPHDAVALTVLAEIENAHGHLDFGRVYLKEALQSLGEREAPEALLERTRQYVQAAQDYLGEPHGALGPAS